MEKGISGTVNSICKDSEFGKRLAVWRNERRPKVVVMRGKVEPGEAEEHMERLSPDMDASLATMEMDPKP